MSFWKTIWDAIVGHGPEKSVDQKSNPVGIRVEVHASFDDQPISRTGEKQPGDFYVYVHRDIEGHIFYVGKGYRQSGFAEPSQDLFS